ncbi:peptidoglycan-binding domain-containing protein [Monashia sp. NPDC004114]
MGSLVRSRGRARRGSRHASLGYAGGRASRPRPVAGVAVTVLAAALLAGCSSSGSGDTAVSAAEAKVTSKQKALDDATAAATAASTAFCQSSSSYITALDRYGDILNQTATTVGDVKTAGRDLKQPAQDAAAAAQSAVDAQRAVTQAQQDLATAEAELAAARAASTAGTAAPKTSTPTTSKTSTPASTAAVSEAATRVQQAESDFTTAQAGIADATPLRQAAQQFNAAAVALEVAWLQLYSTAGCLTDSQQQKAAAAVQDYAKALQQDLAAAGYFDGKVDGVYGPTTVAAVEALQKAHGLPVTGSMDKATEAALRSDLAAKGGAAADASLASTAATQQTLKLAGYWDGPVDGQWTPALTDALKSLQADLGVPTTGTVDSATVAALEKAVEKGKETPTVTVTQTTTKTTTVTATPTPTPS